MITSPKTSESNRTIDIPEFLKQEIKNYYGKSYEYPAGERLSPIKAEAIQHRLKRNVEKAGIKKIRGHELSHSHVAYLIHQGVQPLVIKERIRHRDIRITMNIYGHLYPSKQKSIAAMLNQKKLEVKEKKEKEKEKEKNVVTRKNEISR